jgi:hypothetical protein
MSNTATDPRYPIGKFTPQPSHNAAEISAAIKLIGELPQKLEVSVTGLTNTQLDTPYREGGWTVRQVIHHLADSHMNAYIRFKWTLTEDTPTIKAYNEKLWAETPDASLPVEISISVIKALHQKLTLLLEGLSQEQLLRSFIHPETQKHVALHNLIAMYAWHGAHHTAHITELRKRMNW